MHLISCERLEVGHFEGVLQELVNEVPCCTFFLSQEDHPNALFEPMFIHLGDFNGR